LKKKLMDWEQVKKKFGRFSDDMDRYLTISAGKFRTIVSDGEVFEKSKWLFDNELIGQDTAKKQKRHVEKIEKYKRETKKSVEEITQIVQEARKNVRQYVSRLREELLSELERSRENARIDLNEMFNNKKFISGYLSHEDEKVWKDAQKNKEKMPAFRNRLLRNINNESRNIKEDIEGEIQRINDSLQNNLDLNIPDSVRSRVENARFDKSELKDFICKVKSRNLIFIESKNFLTD